MLTPDSKTVLWVLCALALLCGVILTALTGGGTQTTEELTLTEKLVSATCGSLVCAAAVVFVIRERRQ